MIATKSGSRVMKGIVTAVPVVLLAMVMTAQALLTPIGATTSGVDTTAYGGRAFGAFDQVPLVGGTYYADTGNLPSNGGVLVADFTAIGDSVANGLVFLAYTSGINGTAMSEVATSDITLLSGTPAEVDSSFAYVMSVADCNGVSAATEIPDLTVGGVSVPVTGQPNQLYSIPGVLTLIINEQIDDSSGTYQSITTNALHLWAMGVEIIVSSAHSDVTCGGTTGSTGLLGLTATDTRTNSISAMSLSGPVPQWVPPSDFTTGGGFFEPPNSDWPGRVNFGFNAGPRPGDPTDVKGHLNLVDHLMGHHLDGSVTDYFRASEIGVNDPQDVCCIFAGPATFDGQSGFRFQAGVCDYGEPGRYDRFGIDVFDSNGILVFHADNKRTDCPPDMPNCGELDGGNIKLHRF